MKAMFTICQGTCFCAASSDGKRSSKETVLYCFGEAVIERQNMRHVEIFPLFTDHMGLELPNSFKEVARGDQYGKLTMRHQGFRKYVSPNQTCPFF